MALSEAFAFSATVSTTELSLTGGTSTIQTQTADGIYALRLDLSAMAKGDQFRVKFYEKAGSGSSQRDYSSQLFMGVQAEDAVFPGLDMMHGWDITIVKVAGTDRTITASIRQLA